MTHLVTPKLDRIPLDNSTMRHKLVSLVTTPLSYAREYRLHPSTVPPTHTREWGGSEQYALKKLPKT